MSWLEPSSSHQFLAASVAFRRARRKFPKNFGAPSSPGKSPEHNQGRTVATGDGNHEAASTASYSKSATETKINGETSSTCGSDTSDYRPVKENVPPLLGSCSCWQQSAGREGNEESAREMSNIARTSNDVDSTVDTIPCRDTDCKKATNRHDITYLHVPTKEQKDQQPENSGFHYRPRDPIPFGNKLQKVNSADFCTCNECLANKNLGCDFVTYQRPRVDENRSLDSIRKVCRCKDRQHSLMNSRRLASQYSKFTSCNCRTNTSVMHPTMAHNSCGKSDGPQRCDSQHWCRHCCSRSFHCNGQNRPAERCSHPRSANTYPACGTSNCTCTSNQCAKSSRHWPFADTVHEPTTGIPNDEDSVSVLMGRCGINCRCKNHVFHSDFKVFSEDGNFHTGDNFNSGITVGPDSCRSIAPLEYQGRTASDACPCHASSLLSAGKTCCTEFDRIHREADFNEIDRFSYSSLKRGTCCSAKRSFLGTM